MDGPDGKPVHAELTLRGTTLMLGPESEQMGRRSAKSVGASPATLYIYVENVVEKAAKLGATPQGPVMDMFWGDRCGTVVDPDGYEWMGRYAQGGTDSQRDEERNGGDDEAPANWSRRS